MRWQRLRRPATQALLATTAALTLVIPALRSPAASGLTSTRSRAAGAFDGFLLSSPSARADSAGNRLSADLEARLSAAGAQERLGVIVRYKSGRELGPAARFGPGVRRLALDHSIAVHLTPPEIRRLLADE